MRPIHVHVKLQSGRFEWRIVQAEGLSEAIKVAAAMPDVAWCYEASFIAGGEVT